MKEGELLRQRSKSKKNNPYFKSGGSPLMGGKAKSLFSIGLIYRLIIVDLDLFHFTGIANKKNDGHHPWLRLD